MPGAANKQAQLERQASAGKDEEQCARGGVY